MGVQQFVRHFAAGFAQEFSVEFLNRGVLVGFSYFAVFVVAIDGFHALGKNFFTMTGRIRLTTTV